MTGGRKDNVYTIPPSVNFSHALAHGLIDLYSDESDPLALGRVTVLLPTRRAGQSLHEAFGKIGGGAPMLLPMMRPLGDATEEELDPNILGAMSTFEGESTPPSVPALRRQLTLAQLIVRWGQREFETGDRTAPIEFSQAAALAKDLAHLLDVAQTEEVELTKLEELAPERFAEHWQRNLKFLAIITSQWPEILAAQNCIDPLARRSLLIRAYAKTLEKQNTKDPVIIAGSTGSVPATAALMKAVLGLANGAVILPGLDQDMDEKAWGALDDTHAQKGLKQLLDKLDVTRDQIVSWGAPEPYDTNAGRVRIIQEALRPAETTESWRALIDGKHGKALLDGLAGLSVIEAPDPHLEAVSIALVLRETLEDPSATAALVTPDRMLARRVTAELARWKVKVDDSAGTPLDRTVPGAFLRLIVSATLADDPLAPIELLALLKHPLCTIGFTRPELRANMAAIEIACLRGPRPAPGIDGLREALSQANELWRENSELIDTIDRLEQALSPLLSLNEQVSISFETLLAALVETAEALATTPENSGADCVWAGDAGENVSLFLSELIQEHEALSSVSPREMIRLLQELMAGRVVRPRYGLHPRLFIWGPLEARLQSADVVVLGGLNETVWPPESEVDPWLSRPMRETLNLPSPDRRIGLSAHDFTQLACAPRVVLTRAIRSGGSPTIASRWLMRLKHMVEGLGGGPLLSTDHPYLGWSNVLDRPDKISPISEPLPRPPIDARPRQLSVTEIETWIRDPYAIYARKILGLQRLDPIDADPEAAERGIIIHEALERFIAQHPEGNLPANALTHLIDIGESVFEKVSSRPEIRVFWWPRFLAVAEWFVEREQQIRNSQHPIGWELSGRMELPSPEGTFTLTARADRIDQLVDEAVAIYDYKTGSVPTGPQVISGLSPQLPLEALIVEAGGFETIGPHKVSRLAYLQLKGGDPAGVEKVFDPAKENLLEKTKAGLLTRITQFENPKTPYHSRLRPMFLAYAGPYDHLARVKEWSVYGAEDGA